MTIDDALTCKEVVELVTEYLENVLLPGLRKQFEEHVADCPGCTNYIEQVQLTVGMLQQLAQEPVFPETKQKLLEVFRYWKQSSSPQSRETDHLHRLPALLEEKDVASSFGSHRPRRGGARDHPYIPCLSDPQSPQKAAAAWSGSQDGCACYRYKQRWGDDRG